MTPRVVACADLAEADRCQHGGLCMDGREGVNGGWPICDCSVIESAVQSRDFYENPHPQRSMSFTGPYNGVRCEAAVWPAQECSPSTDFCHNGGTCVNGVDNVVYSRPSCDCPGGFGGRHCTLKAQIDLCSDVTCSEGKLCFGGVCVAPEDAAPHDLESTDADAEVSTPAFVMGSRYKPELLDNWAVGDQCWSDNMQVWSELGDYTPENYNYKVRTSVTQRTSSYSIHAPDDTDIEVTVLSESGQGGPPSVDRSWDTVSCQSTTLPTFEFEAIQWTYDFCAVKSIAAGEALVVPSSGGGRVGLFVRASTPSTAVADGDGGEDDGR